MKTLPSLHSFACAFLLKLLPDSQGFRRFRNEPIRGHSTEHGEKWHTCRNLCKEPDASSLLRRLALRLANRPGVPLISPRLCFPYWPFHSSPSLSPSSSSPTVSGPWWVARSFVPPSGLALQRQRAARYFGQTATGKWVRALA